MQKMLPQHSVVQVLEKWAILHRDQKVSSLKISIGYLMLELLWKYIRECIQQFKFFKLISTHNNLAAKKKKKKKNKKPLGFGPPSDLRPYPSFCQLTPVFCAYPTFWRKYIYRFFFLQCLKSFGVYLWKILTFFNVDDMLAAILIFFFFFFLQCLKSIGVHLRKILIFSTWTTCWRPSWNFFFMF